MEINDKGELILSQHDLCVTRGAATMSRSEYIAQEMASFRARLQDERLQKGYDRPINTIRFRAIGNNDPEASFDEILENILSELPISTLEFDGVPFRLEQGTSRIEHLQRCHSLSSLILKESHARDELVAGDPIFTTGPLGGDAGTLSLAIALAENKLKITSLTLEPDLGLSRDALSNLARSLLTNHTLRTLHLSLKGLSPKNRDDFFEALSINQTLTQIALYYEPSRVSDIKAIANLLKMKKVSSLHLSFTENKMINFNAILDGLKAMDASTSLTLEFPSLSKSEASRLAKVLSDVKPTSVRIRVQKSADEKTLHEIFGKMISVNPSRLTKCPAPEVQEAEPEPFPKTVPAEKLVIRDGHPHTMKDTIIRIQDENQTIAESCPDSTQCLSIAGITLDPQSPWSRYRTLLAEGAPVTRLHFDTNDLLPSNTRQKELTNKEKKSQFLNKLYLHVKYFDLETLLSVYNAIKNNTRESPFRFLHVQEYAGIDKFRLFFKKNPSQEHWQTATFQKAVKILKDRLVKLEANPLTRPGLRSDPIATKRLQLINHERSNFFHTQETSTAKKLHGP